MRRANWALNLILAIVRALPIVGVCIFLFAIAHAQPVTQGSAFTAGQTLGAGSPSHAFGGISSSAVQDKVPSYGVAPLETGYYGGGQGDALGPGTVKISTCETATPNADPIKRQECEAVNFLAGNPDIRPQFSITKNDPMVLSTKAQRDSAEATFQSIGLSSGSSTACTTKTQTTPAQYTTETCSDISGIGMQQCVTGRIISIDSDSNFQCDRTVNGYEILTCKKTVNVEVEASGSTARLVLADFGSFFLFSGGGVSGVWLHNGTGSELPTGGSGTFNGSTLGIDSPGNAYRLDVSSNNCASGICTGSATLSLWRQFNSTWLGLIAATWQQYAANQTQCSFSQSFTTGVGYRFGSPCTVSASSCPSSSDIAILSYSCPNNPVPPGTATLGVNQSVVIEYAQVCSVDEFGGQYCYATDCGGSSWVTYRGNGSFTYSTSGRAGGSCGESGTNSTTFGFPVQQKKVSIKSNNGCAGLEGRVQ